MIQELEQRLLCSFDLSGWGGKSTWFDGTRGALHKKPAPPPPPAPPPVPVPVTTTYNPAKPAIDAGLSWTYCSGPLFRDGTTISDEKQGYVGDCWLIATLGSLGQSQPSLIQKAIVDNGNGTFTVTFHYGINHDRIIVDRYLPADSSGHLYYDGMGQDAATAELWMPMIERAYAEWNYIHGMTNAYSTLNGGWMTNAAVALGATPTQYFGLSTSGYQQILINAVQSGKAVEIGTTGAGGDGLYGSHAYSVSAYDALTGTFTLFNPWNFSQPGPLTYSQLIQDCVAFAVE